jgi:hypothetical protein
MLAARRAARKFPRSKESAMTKVLAALILVTAVVGFGCANNMIYRDPQTGQVVDCTHQGMSSSRTEGGQLSGMVSCARSYERMGWARVN